MIAVETSLSPHPCPAPPSPTTTVILLATRSGASGTIFSPVGRATGGFDDAKVGRACGEGISDVPVFAACTRVCEGGRSFTGKS